MFIFMDDKSTINTDTISGTQPDGHGNLWVYFKVPFRGDTSWLYQDKKNIDAILLGLKQHNERQGRTNDMSTM